MAAVIGALEGAKTVLVGHDGEERVSKIAFTMKWRFGIDVGAVDGSTGDARRAAIAEADVISSAGPAGIRFCPPRISKPRRSSWSPPT